MNSQSYDNSQDRRGCGPDHSCHHPEAGDAILRANSGSFGPSAVTFLATALGTTLNQPIASVTIDTSRLDDPTVLVQFNGVLTATSTVAAGITYNFTLYRNCRGNGFREQLRSFTVAQSIAVITIPDSRGLSFAFSECNEGCEECCTYTLELTSVTATVALTLEVTINGTLSVLAVGEE